MAGDRLDAAVAELTRRFARTRDVREAHRRARPVLADLADKKWLIEAIVSRHLTRHSIAVPHFPVVSFDIAKNHHIHLLANAWMRHPDGRTDVATKAIHHHGRLLLTTTTIFGPGYDHWLFSRPRPGGWRHFKSHLINASRHRRGQPAFVDTTMAHTTLFPPSLSITLCLWTRARSLRHAAMARIRRLPGASRLPALPFDFFPSDDGLCGLGTRHRFPFGPVSDYLASLIHIVQATGCEHLATKIGNRVDDLEDADRKIASSLLARLGRGEAIAGRYSPGHTNDPVANFSASQILASVRRGFRG